MELVPISGSKEIGRNRVGFLPEDEGRAQSSKHCSNKKRMMDDARKVNNINDKLTVYA
jgi:hypothetical protein